MVAAFVGGGVLLLLFLLLAVSLWGGGEAELIFAPAEGSVFDVSWRMEVTETVGAFALSRRTRHAFRAEGSMRVERPADGGRRLIYRIEKVIESDGRISWPRAGSEYVLRVDETGALAGPAAAWWLPPAVFHALPVLRGRHASAGDEWTAKRALGETPYIDPGEAELRLLLSDARGGVAEIRGRLTAPRVTWIGPLDMETTESEVRADYDKEGRFLRRLRLSGALEARNGSRTVEVEAVAVWLPRK